MCVYVCVLIHAHVCVCVAADGPGPALNEFECSPSGQRIARAFFCDGKEDCPNGEDEARCGENYIRNSISVWDIQDQFIFP